MTWVNVREKMPQYDLEKYSAECILYTTEKEVVCGFHKKGGDISAWFLSSGNLDVNITHWMPLPNPPNTNDLTIFETIDLVQVIFNDTKKI